MRSSLRLFSPALRNVASTSRSTGSFRTRTLVGFVAGGVAAYALVPHKQNLMLDAPGEWSYYSHQIARKQPLTP